MIKLIPFDNNDINQILDTLELNLSKLDKFENTYYFDSYFEFLKYFDELEKIDYHSLVISSHFTYGWMPTIITLDPKYMNESILILNKVKNSNEMNNDEYLILVKCINNSIVGVSKLLHFIKPKQYPIFDSRIKKYFKNHSLLHSVYKQTSTKKQEIQQYQIFRGICFEIICHDRFNKIYYESIVKLGINKDLTKMRVLENLFFYFGKQ